MTTILMEEQELMADTDLRRDLRIEGLLREWNIEFEFDPDFPVTKLDADYDESQVRQSSTGHRRRTSTSTRSRCGPARSSRRWSPPTTAG